MTTITLDCEHWPGPNLKGSEIELPSPLMVISLMDIHVYPCFLNFLGEKTRI